MKIDAKNYEQMKAWFAILIPESSTAEYITAENHPVGVLDQMEKRWPSRARAGLAMAIGDTIEEAQDWSVERVAMVDRRLMSEGLPTLTEMRFRFSKVIRRVVTRGIIKNDVEYYAVRNAAELDANMGQELWPLLAAFEAQS